MTWRGTLWYVLCGAAVLLASASVGWHLRHRPAEPPVTPDPSLEFQAAMERAGFGAASRPRPAPPLTVTAPDGTRRSLADLHGRPVLIYFWGNDCPHCVGGLPRLDRLAAATTAGRVEVLAVCRDGDGPDVARKLDLQLPLYMSVS